MNFNLSNHIILKLNSKLRSLELILKGGPDLIKKILEWILLMVFILHNNQPK